MKNEPKNIINICNTISSLASKYLIVPNSKRNEPAVTPETFTNTQKMPFTLLSKKSKKIIKFPYSGSFPDIL